MKEQIIKNQCKCLNFIQMKYWKRGEGFSAGVWYNQICISECSLGNGLEEIKDGFMEIS